MSARRSRPVDRRAPYDVELLKLRRSATVRTTTVALLLLPPLMALGFLAAAERDVAGTVGAKAAALDLGEGWTGYLNGLVQVFASAGLLGAGVVTAWCFGREFADRTVGSLYGCATPRTASVTAKLVLVAAWGLGVAALVPVVAMLVGLAGALGPPTPAAVAALGRLAVLAAATVLLAAPVAWVASAGRGYLPAFGAVVALLVLAQAAVLTGAGAWVPWSVPGLWAVSTPGSGLPPVPVGRLALVPVSALLAGWLTRWWWRRAEVA